MTAARYTRAVNATSTRAARSVPVLVAAAVGLAYLPALRGGFVYDDHLFFGPGSAVQGPLWRLWATASSPDYWPLTMTSFWAEWRLWGEHAAGYHATNVALHAAAAVLLWRVLLRLRIPGAWLGALLFAVHPVAADSVSWISERKNTLSGVLFLAAALAWIRLDDDGRRRDHLASLALFALALLAKTSVVMLPPVLAGAVLARRGRLERRDLARLAPYFGLALAAGLVTMWFQWRNAMALLWLPPRGPIERLAGAAWALGSYVQKAYVPVGLSFVHPGWPVDADRAVFYAPVALLAVAGAAAWRLRRGPARPLVLALGYQALLVLPVLGLVNIAYFDVAPVSNHLQYLALPGACAVGGAALAGAAARWGRLVLVGAAALAVSLAASTAWRAAAFEDELTLWQHAVRDAPDAAYAHGKLAIELAERGRRPEALAELAEMARVARDASVRHFALSYWHLFQGRPEEALANAREAVRIKASPDLRRHLGLQLVVTGRTAEAVPVLERLVRESPADPDYRYWLGRALAAQGRVDEAEAQLTEALRLAPSDAAARDALAAARAARARGPR